MLKVLFRAVSDSSVAPTETMYFTASLPSFWSLLTNKVYCFWLMENLGLNWFMKLD